MKKITIPLILLVTAFIFSCSVDEENHLVNNTSQTPHSYLSKKSGVNSSRNRQISTKMLMAQRYKCLNCGRISYSSITMIGRCPSRWSSDGSHQWFRMRE